MAQLRELVDARIENVMQRGEAAVQVIETRLAGVDRAVGLL